MLRRSPALAATIILTLALGIGANTAIFTVVNSVLLRPLPVRDPARLVAIWDRYESEGAGKIGVSPAEYDQWRRQTDIFEDIARYRYVGIGRDMNLTGRPGARTRADNLGQLQPLLDARRAPGRGPILRAERRPARRTPRRAAEAIDCGANISAAIPTCRLPDPTQQRARRRRSR